MRDLVLVGRCFLPPNKIGIWPLVGETGELSCFRILSRDLERVRLVERSRVLRSLRLDFLPEEGLITSISFMAGGDVLVFRYHEVFPPPCFTGFTIGQRGYVLHEVKASSDGTFRHWMTPCEWPKGYSW